MLRRHLIWLALAWTVAWPAAATAPAAATETVAFEVTVAGTQRTVVTSVRRSVDDLGCSVRRADEGRRTMTFATRTPARVRISVPGGTTSARVAVSVGVSGATTLRRTVSGQAPECDLAPQTTESACGPLSVVGTAVVRLRAPGAVALTGSLARRRDAARCSPSAGRAQPFLVGSEGRFPAGLLTDRTAARIHLRGDARFTDTLASGARRVTTVSWTVVLRRLS